MKHIQIENGINRETPWTKNFIEIGKVWEDTLSGNGYDIEGYINPYKITAKFAKIIQGNKLQIEITRKLDNVKGWQLDLKPARHTEFTIVKIDFNNPINFILKLKKKNLLSIILDNGLESKNINKYSILHNSNFVLEKIIENDILSLDEIQVFNIKHRKLFFNQLKVEKNTTNINKLINLGKINFS